MCSGCSGEFDGDGEERDFEEGDRFDRDGELPKAARCGGDDDGWLPAGITGATGTPQNSSSALRLATDDYEVLVSGEHIIERRRIRANPPSLSEIESLGAATVWKESRAERERAAPATARSYRTQIPSDSATRSEGQMGSMSLISWYLGALAAFTLVLWLALG